MNFELKIKMILIAVVALFCIFYTLKKNKLSVRYSVLWSLLPVSCLLMAIFSEPMLKVAHLLGFKLLSNMIFFIIIGVLLIITFVLTIIVNNLNKKVTKLTQEVAILEKEKRK